MQWLSWPTICASTLALLGLASGNCNEDERGVCHAQQVGSVSASSDFNQDDAGESGSCGCGSLKRKDFNFEGGTASDEGANASPTASGEQSDDDAAIIYLEGGRFTMGIVPADIGDPTISPFDNEAPPREVSVKAFGLGAFEVSNRRFSRFVESTGYVTESESFGWSFGVEAFISPEQNTQIESLVANAPWWLPIKKADWRHPNGPDTNITNIMDHPVTQTSMRDAKAFCKWSRVSGRLPSEAEWEFAARGGKNQRRFPWGNQPLTGKDRDQHRMNIWQSTLDEKLVRDGKPINLHGMGERSLAAVKEYYSSPNAALDGFNATAPVDAYGPQNNFGFYNMVGNVWEWTSTLWARSPGTPPVEENSFVKKGGSFLCNPSTCYRFRSSARMMFTADSAASNVGFRCAYDWNKTF